MKKVNLLLLGALIAGAFMLSACSKKHDNTVAKRIVKVDLRNK
jgi:hypothetical protein